MNGLSIRAIRVSHIVPTTGFVVEDKTGAVAYSSDTAPTERFWEIVNETRNLKAVIVETSFPNELQDLANVSGHLTPQTLDRELRKLEARRARLPLRRQAAPPRPHPGPGPRAQAAPAGLPGPGQDLQVLSPARAKRGPT